jgi:hypothetical protein
MTELFNEISLSVISQLLKSLFLLHIDRNIGFTNAALLSNNIDSLSNAPLIFSIIDDYDAINSNASVNSP